MLKRTLVFTNPVSLSLRNCQLVVHRKEQPEEPPTTVPIEDIGTVVVESQRATLTIPLINALAESGVQVVFCNERNMPASLLLPFEGNSTQCETLRAQMDCGEVLKKQLWKQIVEAKIRNQAALLDKVGAEGNALRPYYSNVKSGDSDNREGAAARIYFQLLFGYDFVRNRNLDGIDSLLNYGYSILRAAVARAIVGSGLYPGIGMFHHHRSNAFPLADDLMEPYRPFVDEIVFNLNYQGCLVLNKEVKAQLIRVLYADTAFQKVTRPLSVGLSFTTASLVKCYKKEEKSLSLPHLK